MRGHVTDTADGRPSQQIEWHHPIRGDGGAAFHNLEPATRPGSLKSLLTGEPAGPF